MTRASTTLACLLWLALVPAASAQEPAQTESRSPEAVVAIGAEEMADVAAELQQTLRILKARSRPLQSLERVAGEVAEAAEHWDEGAREALETLTPQTSPTVLDELQRVWTAWEDLVEEWSALLRRRVGTLTDDLDELDRQREIWEASRDTGRKAELSPALQETVREVLADIAATRGAIVERRGAALELQRSVLRLRRQVTDVLQAVREARRDFRSRLFVRESPALWHALPRANPGEAMEQARHHWASSIDAVESYASEEADEIVVLLVLFVGLILGIALVGRLAARGAGDGNAAPTRLLRRPVSAALLILLITYPLILSPAPLLLRWIAGIVLLAPALRLVGPLLEGTSRRAFYWLTSLYAVDLVRMLLVSAPLFMRILVLVEAAVAAVLLMRLLRPGRLAAFQEQGALQLGSARWRIVGLVARIALVLLWVSLIANLVGNVSLAELLLAGTLRGAYVAVLLLGSAFVLDDLWAILLRTPALRTLRAVRHYPTLVRRRVRTLSRWTLTFVGVWLTLGFFRLRQPVGDGLAAAASATWPVGEVELTLGDLVAFGLTLWLAIWLSRFLRFVLDEEVLPRADLPRGVPHAISSGVRYLILLVGFLLAIAAAGFEMSRIALIIGALGVGIGIGLQDVVNNFVSGLILLFERPVKPGDAVQVGEVLGEVRDIGIRSSTVRTWSGAEVIVPNSKLVSENVVNWTLSDTLRRVEIPIGVAYGSDPQRVIALLLETARLHPAVLEEPEPAALFQAHGDSSLDFELRAWTSTADWLTVRSELRVAIHRALREAGIEIPFPQRDLHLRSVDPAASDALQRSAKPATDTETPRER
ncbi:MAG: mechanosensitive ion channel [Chromatiales bacterium]|jgi:small-conductance mechanosensitive channel